jgi:hypothetical protein
MLAVMTKGRRPSNALVDVVAERNGSDRGDNDLERT